jgi:hypothetical protein
MQIAGTVIILFGIAFWRGHTHKVPEWNDRPPEQCQVFDYRYAPEYKAMCDKWEKDHER